MLKKFKFTFDEIKAILLEHGYEYVDGEYIGINSKLTCKDRDGFYVLCIVQKMLYDNKSPRIVDCRNPYSIYNIKRIINENTYGEFDCMSDEYRGTKETLVFRHNVCGRTFENSWHNIGRGRYRNSPTSNKTGLFCPHCNAKQLESTHALVLKQVWMHEESDTIVEEKSCINPNTNRPLPTDIVNHRLKIAIEIQSWFHDSESQKKKDVIKKDFWIKNGYSFYAVDHRDYTVLEMIQIFFPYIKEIPNYIDFDYSNKINDILAQKKLNEGMSVIEVAEFMNCTPHTIYDAIQNKRISYPENYVYDFYTQVVQLDLNKEFVAEYNSLKEAENTTGVLASNISQCLQKNRNFTGGYYWVYKRDYDSGNYTIVTHRSDKFFVPIDQLDMNGNFIKHFNTIIEASKEVGSNNQDIYRVAIGDRTFCKGFKWRFSNANTQAQLSA